MEIAGHIVGAIAIATYFLSYQFSDKKKLLAVQTAATALNCLQYLLIGASSGFALNIVCIVRNILFFAVEQKGAGKKFAWLPYALAVVMGVVSLFSWDGVYSLLIIVGLMLNTVFMGICNSQNLRKSLLLTCSMVVIYNIFAGSYTGIISESISIISAIIGIIRFRNEEKINIAEKSRA